jgi:hypothetical protein
MYKKPIKYNLLEGRSRAERAPPPGPCVVETKTIGTTLAYNLPLENFSRTGFLLSSGPYLRIPFQINTILELNVDPRGTVFEQPFQFLAKIVRLNKKTTNVSHYGVQILQVDSKDAHHWQKALDRIEGRKPTA